MQQPRLVASDVDGTLLPDVFVPTDRTRAAVAAVLAAGIPFALVTGRPPRWIPPIAQYLPGVRHAVCANGAVRYDIVEDRVLSSVTLTVERLRAVARAAEESIPGCWFAAERVGLSAFDDAGAHRVEEGHRPNWANDFITAPRAELLSEPAIKLLIRHDELKSDQMLAVLRAHTGDDVALTFSNPNGLLEAAAAGVDKASGLAGLAAELGVDAADVIAFGDMPNDVEMLTWAGHGVAMGNAHPDVRAVADEVTAPNVEDGVALVLERWF